MIDLTGKWCYSTDAEEYTGRFDTELQAHAAAKGQMDLDVSEFGLLCSYWVAQCVHPLDVIRQDIGDRVVEMVVTQMEDEVCSFGPAITLSKAHEVELGKLVVDFLRKHSNVKAYAVSSPVKHQHVVGH